MRICDFSDISYKSALSNTTTLLANVGKKKSTCDKCLKGHVQQGILLYFKNYSAFSPQPNIL